MFKKVSYLLLALAFLVGMVGFVPEAVQAGGGGDVTEYVVPDDVIETMKSLPRPTVDTVPAMPLPKVPRNAVLSGGAADYSGKSGRGAGAPADPAMLASVNFDDVPASQELLAGMEPFAKALRFTDYPVNYYGRNFNWPFYTIGRLWIMDGGSFIGWCTAAVINPNYIVTASHCVYDTYTNQWYDGWEFDPFVYGMGYSNPWTPDIYFNATNAVMPTRYQLAADWWRGRAYDVALISLGTYGGQPVHYYTGYMGWAYGAGPVQLQNSFGYPGNIQSGNSMWQCVGQSSASGKYWMKMGCPMEGGSSGGPWVMWFDSEGYYSYANYVNGTVSGGVPGSNIANAANFVWDNFGILCSAWGFC